MCVCKGARMCMCLGLPDSISLQQTQHCGVPVSFCFSLLYASCMCVCACLGGWVGAGGGSQSQNLIPLINYKSVGLPA